MNNTIHLVHNSLTIILYQCRKLSTFKVTRYGEARAYYNPKQDSGHQAIGKCRLFPDLPRNLSDYNKWIPYFQLFYGFVGLIRVIFRAKDEASQTNLQQWQSQVLARVWWQSILIPAVHSLPFHSRTRRANTTGTHLATKILPTYIRMYDEDMAALDAALTSTTLLSNLNQDLDWYFVCWQMGQRRLLKVGEELGPKAFGLSDAFDLSSCCKFSAHLALNLRSTDPAYSLFWDTDVTFHWSASSGNGKFLEQALIAGKVRQLLLCCCLDSHWTPLFSVRNYRARECDRWPTQKLQARKGCERAQCCLHTTYTPTFKAMESRVPLATRPHLLTYLLGSQYVSTKSKFNKVWSEVNEDRTKLELQEVVDPRIPLEARLEVVITEDNPSFLSSFNHQKLAKYVINDKLLIKVSLWRR